MRALRLVALVLLCCLPTWAQWTNTATPKTRSAPSDWPSDWPDWLVTAVEGIGSESDDGKFIVRPENCILIDEVVKRIPRVDSDNLQRMLDKEGRKAADKYLSSVRNLPAFGVKALASLRDYGDWCSVSFHAIQWPKDESGVESRQRESLDMGRKIHVLLNSHEISRSANLALQERANRAYVEFIDDYNSLVAKYNGLVDDYNGLLDRYLVSVGESERILNLYEGVIQSYQSSQSRSTFWAVLERLGRGMSDYSNTLRSYQPPPAARSLRCTSQTYDSGFRSLGSRTTIQCSEE